MYQLLKPDRWLRLLVALCAALAITFAPATAQAVPALSQAPTKPDAALAASCARVSFQNPTNGRYVSAELSQTSFLYGMLRARATSVGPWERFILCHHDSGGFFTIQSEANGQYVRVEELYEGRYHWMLRAAAPNLSSASGFYRWTGEVAWSAFQSSADGHFVSTELSYTGSEYGMLRARATSIGPWEKFIVGIR